MKNKLVDLNNHLFAELERLSDEDLQGDELTAEIDRAKAITGVASQIIANGTLALKARVIADNSLSADFTEHAAGTTNKKLADLINARFGDGYMTESQVKAYRKNHHLPSGLPKGRATYFSRIFPEPVVRYIMDNYVGTGPTEMAGKLNAAFETNYTVAQINGYYSNHHLNCGITGRFEKGHVPANKGKHPPTVGRMAETQFMKGNLPHNTKPIGYERISKDGYVEVKVKMRPSSPYCNDNFIPKHRLLWEAENGPVPKGHKLIFADGDKTNISLDNLLLITDAQMARLNKSGFVKVDKDLTVASLLVCDVISKTARRKEEMTRGKKHEKNC